MLRCFASCCLFLASFSVGHLANDQVLGFTYSTIPISSGTALQENPLDGTYDLLDSAASIDVLKSDVSSFGLGRGLMEFDIQVIPSNAVVQSATLDLFTAIGTGTPTDVEVLGYNADGIVELGDATVSASSIDTLTLADQSSFQVDVTSFIANSLGSSTHVGFRGQLADETAPPEVATSLGDTNAGGSLQPVLTINFLAEQLLINGDFEIGQLSPWVTSDPFVAKVGSEAAYLQLSGTTGALPPQNGDHFVTFSAGNQQNGESVFQDIASVSGREYIVSLEFGGFGTAGISQELTVEVEDIASESLITSATFLDPSASNNLGGIFEPGELSFTASGASTRITLIDTSTATNSVDLFVDNVSAISLLADFDEGGDVDGIDFLTWQRGFGTDAGPGNVAPLAEGNANIDQFIDGDDLAIWETQYGGSPPLAATTVPEPSGAILMLSALCAVARCRR